LGASVRSAFILIIVFMHAAAAAPALDLNRPPQAIRDHCGQSQREAEAKLVELSSLSDQARTFGNTPSALDTILWDMRDRAASDAFTKYVSVSSAAREAANECETRLNRFASDVFTREDLYKAVSAYAAKHETLSPEDARLLAKELLDFKRNGQALPRKQRDRLKSLRQEIERLEGEFQRNRIEASEALLVSSAELSGLPPDFIARLPRVGDKFKVSVDYTFYYPFMDNARDPEARRKLQEIFDNKAAKGNLPILKKTLTLRREAAALLGYKNHAAYALETRMAGNLATVESFLDRLVGTLRLNSERELSALVAFKDKELGAASDHVIHAWDLRYYENQALRARGVDKEKIKDYFPLETVLAGMLDVYQRLLGLRFRSIEDPSLPARWAPGVKLYEVADAVGHQTLGYFYLDLFAREGKFKAEAAFNIVSARERADGSFQVPVSVLLASFAPPAAGKPALLKFGADEEVERLFHEFGHILHFTLSRAHHGRFASAQGTLDFIEAPSQMMENWVWDPKVLLSLSGRFDDPSQKLPQDLLDRMIAEKHTGQSLQNLYLLFLARLDLAFHTLPDVVDTTALYAKLRKETFPIPMMPGTHPEVNFGHIMGGYDAGYYTYLWSRVYSDDMFSVFYHDGLLNPETGRRYRQEILEPGSSREEIVSLQRFLGREPEEKAFLRRMIQR